MVRIWSVFFYVTILTAINESNRLSSLFTPNRTLFLKPCQTRDDNRLHGDRSVVKLFTSQSGTSCHVGRGDGASSAAACARVWSLTRQQTRGNKHARQWWLRQVFLTEPFSRFYRSSQRGEEEPGAARRSERGGEWKLRDNSQKVNVRGALRIGDVFRMGRSKSKANNHDQINVFDSNIRVCLDALLLLLLLCAWYVPKSNISQVLPFTDGDHPD